MPLRCVQVFGNLTNSFLKFTHIKNTVLDEALVAAARAQLHAETRDSLLYLVYLGLATLVTTYAYMSAWVFSGDVITRRIRQAYFAAVLRQDMAFFDQVGAGEVTSRLEADVQLIQEGISDKIPTSFMLISTFVAGLVVAFVRCWKLTLALTAIVPLVIVTGGIMNNIVSKIQADELESVTQAANVAQEALASVRTAKAFGIENCLVRIYNHLNVRSAKLGFVRANVAAVGMGVFFFLIYSAYALAFYFGSKLVADGEIHAGSVMSVVFSILVGTFSIAMLAPNLQALGYAVSAAAKVFETIDRIPSIDSSSEQGLAPIQPRKSPTSFAGAEVALRNVSFCYPSRPDVKILERCSIHFAAGSTTALVGPSGSGKSTIVSFLERFYDPNEGEVLIDGVPVASMNLQHLRSQIGLVSQEPTLFATSVRQNIEYGLTHSRFDDADVGVRKRLVEEAAIKANAHDFIRRLPQGYDTLVGDRGMLLSGGQKQRIAIARAIVKDPPILLLDEATSALDAQSEAAVQKALDGAARGRTTIHIAHRLSTIRNSDKIIVMANGGKGVVEEGKHSELISRNGIYAGMVRAQELSSKKEAAVEPLTLADESQTPYEDGAGQMRADAVESKRGEHGFRSSLDIAGTLRRLSVDALSVRQRFRSSLDTLGNVNEHTNHPRNQHRYQFDRNLVNLQDTSVQEQLSKEGSESTAIHSPQDVNDEEETKDRSTLYVLFRLAMFNRERLWSLYIPGLLGAAAFGAVYPCFAILLGRTLNSFSACNQSVGSKCPQPANAHMRSEADRNALWFFVVALLATVAMASQTLCLIRNSVTLMAKLRRASLHTMLHSDTAFFDQEAHSSGALSSSLAANASRINGLLGITMGSIVQSVSTLVCGVVIAFIFGWKLSLVVVACIPLTLSAGLVRLKLVVLKDAKLKVAHRKSAQRACEAVAAIRTVASLTLEKTCLANYHNDLETPTRMARRTAVYGNILFAFTQSISFWVTALAFWMGSRLLARGEYTSEQFFTIFTAVVFGSLQAGNVFNFTPDISSARQAANESIRLLDTTPKLEFPVPYEPCSATDSITPDRKSSKVSEKGSLDGQQDEKRGADTVQACRKPGSVVFEGVHFHYPTRPHVPVLRGMSLEIQGGTSCAFVGSSGCGKSTMIQLLERFYAPTRGRILVDGRDVASTNPRDLRRDIALVSQEPMLFEGTIAFNIACGLAEDGTSTTLLDGPRSDEIWAKIRDAAAQANVLSFIDSLPDGFETNVGRAGTQLSGGQKQRIALARALIRNPKILLLDEATSALDAESERVVQAALDKAAAAKGRTTIAIAHRLASVVRADKIFYLRDGVVAESGTHEELLARSGDYAELVAMQSLDEKRD